MELISTDTVQNRVYQAIKEAIMTAHFEPGASMTIRGLASTLGTSSMPVREALKRLIAERAVDSLPNRTYRIPILSKRRALEIINVRILLEGEAAAMAAKKIRPEEIEELEFILEAGNKALTDGDIGEYLVENRKLHFSVYSASGNGTILPLIESLWLQYAPAHAVVFQAIKEDHDTMEIKGKTHHEDLVRAIRNKNGEAARLAIKDDIMDMTVLSRFWDYFEDEVVTEAISESS